MRAFLLRAGNPDDFITLLRGTYRRAARLASEAFLH